VIRSAIVPVAGSGTRLLPATKSQPKEMLPVGKKPVVQYVVEELARAGIEQILFVTGKAKHSIENHFDYDHELLRRLSDGEKKELLAELEFERMQVSFFYTRQRRQRGLGDAVLCGQRFAGQEPFVIALGDSILGLHANSSCVAQMIAAFEAEGACGIIAVEEVSPDMTQHYGVVRPDGAGPLFAIEDLVEKPAPGQAPSNLAIAGRYLFTPIIFDAIRHTKPDKRGEVQLTDAMRVLRGRGYRIMGLKLPPGERRYDIGNFESYFATFLEFALADPVYGPEVKKRLLELVQTEARLPADG